MRARTQPPPISPRHPGGSTPPPTSVGGLLRRRGGRGRPRRLAADGRASSKSSGFALHQCLVDHSHCRI
eukprot:15456858-Alexandrium_andersonii.AAC.1